MRKRWKYQPPDEKLQAHLADSLRVSPLLAQLLINRGMIDPPTAHAFLQPKLRNLSNPVPHPEMEKAALRLVQAVRGGEKIVIYGDYDVDGVSATALLLRCLTLLKARVSYYIPERIDEGYGLNTKAIERLAQEGTKVIVTVDCGITSTLEAELALEKGIDLIITDHHEPGKKLPRAFAIINPKLPDSGFTFQGLSGAGVAFKLAWALGEVLSMHKRVSPEFREFLLNAVGLAALGTIADSVPLVGENRILAKFGLDALGKSTLPGIVALREVADLNPPKTDSLSPYHVEFRLGPRLNAAGRLWDASISLELLTTPSLEKARRIAQFLEKKNRERQKLQLETLEDAREKVRKEVTLASTWVIVLSSEAWHPGVIGIVASRLVEEFNRPVVMIAQRGQIGYGSARSIPALHLHVALETIRKKLLSFGGHSQAAGLKIRQEDIEGFRTSINQFASCTLKEEHLEPVLYTDGELSLERLSLPQVRELEHLCPHGEGNPEPLFMTKDLRVAGQPCRLGTSGQHLSLYLRQGDVSFRAIAYDMGETLPQIERNPGPISIAFTPKINTWRNEVVELEVEDIKFAEGESPLKR